MATKKQTAIEEKVELTEPDAPAIDTGEGTGDGRLEQENSELKIQMASMQAQMKQMQDQMAAQLELMQQMAAGKVEPPRPKTQTDIDRENIRRIAEETAASGKDPWTVDVDVFVPHRDRGEDKWYWIKVNDRSVQIPADDSRQTVKLPFALILVDTIKAKQREDEYTDNVVVHDPVTNPHQGKP